MLNTYANHRIHQSISYILRIHDTINSISNIPIKFHLIRVVPSKRLILQELVDSDRYNLFLWWFRVLCVCDKYV